jgi:hypothetical protein
VPPSTGGHAALLSVSRRTVPDASRSSSELNNVVNGDRVQVAAVRGSKASAARWVWVPGK